MLLWKDLFSDEIISTECCTEGLLDLFLGGGGLDELRQVIPI
jgi:hypothetical protein